jgi:hypothetical protein
MKNAYKFLSENLEEDGCGGGRITRNNVLEKSM